MYRRTKKAKATAAKMAAFRAAKARRRIENGEPREAAWTPPDLRIVIEVTRYDFGVDFHRVELRRCNRIDCYDSYIDGRAWLKRVGLTHVLAGLRKALPRVGAA